MICLLALVVFSILGIFSVSYRQLAKKAVDCVFRRITLRPCQSGMDTQLRSQLIGIISRKNIKAARFVVRYFEVISWTFTLIMVLSLVFSIRGIYFYVVYGNCNGQGSDQFCVFDALNPKEEYSCEDPSLKTEKVLVAPRADDDPFLGNIDAKLTIIEFGCYTCPFTKEAQPVVKQIIKNYPDVKFVFRDFPLPTHNESKELAMSAYCAVDESNYWRYHEMLFGDHEYLDVAETLGFDMQRFRACLDSEEAKIEVEKDFEDGKAAGIYGTPTFFIGNVTVIGPKPYRYFKTIIDSELKKLD
jgi:protein-disulfide isomerase